MVVGDVPLLLGPLGEGLAGVLETVGEQVGQRHDLHARVGLDGITGGPTATPAAADQADADGVRARRPGAVDHAEEASAAAPTTAVAFSTLRRDTAGEEAVGGNRRGRLNRRGRRWYQSASQFLSVAPAIGRKPRLGGTSGLRGWPYAWPGSSLFTNTGRG